MSESKINYKQGELENINSLSPEILGRLPYNPKELPRELKTFYISADEMEIKEMLSSIGLEKREQLFSHLPEDIMMTKASSIGPRLPYGELAKHVEEIAAKNNIRPCFLGDGLKWSAVHEIVPFVCSIRGLTTAYTPYQPERSQGTLHTLWNYASTLSMLTGFEAINASLYDRSTALFEALNTALRIKRNTRKVIVSEGIYPGDIEVLNTLAQETDLEIIYIPLDEHGLVDEEKLMTAITDDVAAVAIPQINSLGKLENIHTLSNLIQEKGALVIGIIDPQTLASGGLTPPNRWGKSGADMIVGEGQHLGIGPNFGGPGLGLFGIRFNETNRNAIRSTAGRFVGKAKDEEGKDCLVMVLSTREQHIRREKATSNICSNQSFLATIVGASLLAKGENGLKEANLKGHHQAQAFAQFINEETSLELYAPETPFFNEVAIKLPVSAATIIEKARVAGLHIGVDITERVNTSALLIYFNDAQTQSNFEELLTFLKAEFGSENAEENEIAAVPADFYREGIVGLPNFSLEELKTFYQKLGDMNVSPDDSIYPLGSCTMKYNPYINDYAAGLQGFTDLHPQAPLADAQGSLEVLYEIQEQFKSITGLPGVTTQPVAGAQGELVGIKMFQAYHRAKGNGDKKDIILIPSSAHGTNPATATMAGFETKGRGETASGIIPIQADSNGQIDFNQLKESVELYKDRIAGIMITNPNTSGIFEARFKEIADLIHSVDGLVYMDGANMNAVAGWVDLDAMGVDAVHNNLHKTWTIPHGGGGPGDAIVAVSSKLIDFMPGKQIIKKADGTFDAITPKHTIGSFHRHWGNFAHKVRAYTYIRALGDDGVREMAAIAVLSAKYLFARLRDLYPTLPTGADQVPRMHEFIITISKETFDRIQEAGTPRAQAIGKIGKLFLDFGLHAPTVSFPEPFGLMVEPTESFSKAELDDFVEVLVGIHQILKETPEVLKTAPHFTPVRKVDEVAANKYLNLSEPITKLFELQKNIIEPGILKEMSSKEVINKIKEAHAARMNQ
ncbi:MAG: aminomethyl-transferring glycine dehydrogenase subunit GcvPB [Bacteriovoracaceae bacterium]|nr:aminomethyl-transferring glycine dehydrogenase subunit GcvPB [Bacteriovoracaceae bacterium]